ncbi:DUF5994 family protein [Streptomyces sp. NPDC091371]|uniref:DUF5994 family protein n=1 Tax=Streptomyces sp. NPDC091371 TaxID=3155303 RepID=UPI003414AE24
MADADTPHTPALVLPDAIHSAVRPGTALLRLETTGSREGVLVIDARIVHLDSDPVGDDTVLITRGDKDHFALLVVPPDTTPDAARTAMASAVRADNITSGAEILVAPASAPESERGEPT